MLENALGKGLLPLILGICVWLGTTAVQGNSLHQVFVNQILIILVKDLRLLGKKVVLVVIQNTIQLVMSIHCIKTFVI